MNILIVGALDLLTILKKRSYAKQYLSIIVREDTRRIFAICPSKQTSMISIDKFWLIDC